MYEKTYAVISDLHGNYKAAEAFLEYCRLHSIAGIIGLGDYLTDGPYPERMISLLKQMQAQYPCFMVRGNRENYLLDNLQNPQGWKPSSPSGCLYYTSRRLSASDMSFLESMPEEMQVCIDGFPSLFICHGTPGQVRGNVDFDPSLRDISLLSIQEDYLLGGHSHKQELYRFQNKTYLNPGAMGCSLDGIGRHAHFALLHGAKNSGRWDIELISIPYDAEAFLKDFTESGLDELGFVLNRAVKKTILTGINYSIKCVQRAEELTGLAPYQIPEAVWNSVSKELEL